MICDPIASGQVPTLSDPYAGDGEPVAVRDAFRDPGNGERVAWLEDYYVVGDDPGRIMFLDDDAQVIAETNYAAARDVIGGALEIELWTDYPRHAGWTRYLLAPADERETVQSLLSALADYPLLDESAYCERDHAAWSDCWDSYACADVTRGVIAALDQAGAGFIAQLLEDYVIDIDATAAQESMSYYHGLTGEYDETGAIVGALGAISETAQAF